MKVAVIGAGSSGITVCQSLQAKQIPFVCFERGSSVGGNWKYENDNGMSAAYRSLHINTSKQMMEYKAYPMPEALPDYPSHFQIARYFEDFVQHFSLRDKIRFQTEVRSVRPLEKGWTVSSKNLQTNEKEEEEFSHVIVCSGHHWEPRFPEPSFPGKFSGSILHAHDYRTPEIFQNKNVLIVGLGNSATDIAVEASRTARRTYLSFRTPAWIVPKYLAGQPTDLATDSEVLNRLPLPVRNFLLRALLRLSQGKLENYGMPKPKHGPLQAHPTVSSDLLPRLGHGDIQVKRNIKEFLGNEVVFEDGSKEEIDLIVYCTGYKISFPFLPKKIINPEDNEVALYRKIVHPDYPSLFFVGLIQPLGAIMPLAEAQGKWICQLLLGQSLPSQEKMWEQIRHDRKRMQKRYTASKRHTIQVDFRPYLRELGM